MLMVTVTGEPGLMFGMGTPVESTKVTSVMLKETGLEGVVTSSKATLARRFPFTEEDRVGKMLTAGFGPMMV